MATLELSNLTEHLDPDEISNLNALLSESGFAPLETAEEEDEEPVMFNQAFDDDVFVDFVDRLDANDAHADIYLPSEFEEVLELGEHRIGSAHALLTILDALREDFSIEDDGADDDASDDDDQEPVAGDDDYEALDDDDDIYAQEGSSGDLKDEMLSQIWRQMHRAARMSVARGLCVFVRS